MRVCLGCVVVSETDKVELRSGRVYALASHGRVRRQRAHRTAQLRNLEYHRGAELRHLEGQPEARGLHSSAFWLSVSAFCGIGGAYRGCLEVV